MATVFMRGSSAASPKKSFPKAHEISRGSRLSVQWISGEYLRLTFIGAAAKFPSVSNNRNISIPRGGLMKQLCMMKARPSSFQAEKAIQMFSQLQPIVGKNPAALEVLTACKTLWLEKMPQGFFPFASSIDERLLMLVCCDEALRLTDTHNILKAACDWSQDVGIFKNDLHVDAMALRTADYFPAEQFGTHFIYLPQSKAQRSVIELLRACMPQDDTLKPKEPAAQQQTSFI